LRLDRVFLPTPLSLLRAETEGAEQLHSRAERIKQRANDQIVTQFLWEKGRSIVRLSNRSCGAVRPVRVANGLFTFPTCLFAARVRFGSSNHERMRSLAPALSAVEL